MPSWVELSHFLTQGSRHLRLREDPALEHLHRSSNRAAVPPFLAILAFDHRAQLEELATRSGADVERITRFKHLVAQAAEQGYALEQAGQISGGKTGAAALPGPGVIVDGRYGASVLNRLTGTGLWIGRPVERPGSRPLAFEDGEQLGLALRSWPAEQVVKCLLSHHPDDEAGLARQQLATVQALAHACHATGHELLLELIPPRDWPGGSDAVARGVQQIYDAGVRPDWWKLPPPDSAGWALLTETITRHDPLCRGVLLLGLEASEEQLWLGFRAAAGQPLCKGFAVGRTLFAEAAAAWFAGALDDAGVVSQVGTRYRRLIRLWQDSQATATQAPGTLQIATQETRP
jgi:5-dehydro-2-deoxygluconokinase